MKTLLVYYSNQKNIRSLCEASAREGEVDVLELRERYDRGVLSAATVGSYLASRGMGSQSIRLKSILMRMIRLFWPLLFGMAARCPQ